MLRAAPQADRTIEPTRAAPPRHTVQFYHDEPFLCEAVAGFLAHGLAERQPAVVVATPAHRKGIEARLRTMGIDPARARFRFLDARELLSRFMEDGIPDPSRFRATLEEILEPAAGEAPGTPPRIFGEMVDLLWKDGNPDGAIRLEVLWNELAETHPFSLLCGYAIANFDSAGDADDFLRICTEHDHVLPTETYSELDEGDRHRRIAQLEQRAQALEGELAYRRKLEAELRAAAAEAAAANRAKADFLSSMSHELRTPLNAIAGYVDLIREGVYGPINDDQRQAISRVRYNHEYLLSLVDDVLQFARMEEGHLEIASEEVRVAELIGETAALLEQQIDSAGLRCAFGVDEPSLTVRGDRKRLRQILLNLVSNAIKFTPDGGSVTVSCEEAEEQRFARIRVRDTGNGIDADMLDQIFDPFIQAPDRDGRDSSRQGVGLGLAISRHLTEAMGGQLSVESTPGEGSTFTLTLPRCVRNGDRNGRGGSGNRNGRDEAG